MTTTPEQLAKWREEFEKPLIKEDLVRDAEYPADYQDREIESNWIGYLRRCQETEQAIKDARKQTIEDCSNFAKDWAMEHVIKDDATMSVGDYVIKSMELLK